MKKNDGNPEKNQLSSLCRGLAAEEEAARVYLSARESRLICRGYRWKGGEIDLIFEDRVTSGESVRIELVFVEVRTRARSAWVSAIDSVDPKKRHRIQNTARMFLAGYRGKAKSIRFDVMAWDGARVDDGTEDEGEGVREGGWVHLENAWVVT